MASGPRKTARASAAGGVRLTTTRKAVTHAARSAATERLSTRPDPLDRPQESAASTLRDAWKLLAYLAPVLLVVLLAIRGLKALYAKHGRLPSLPGGLTLWTARKAGGSSIRVLESVPVGVVGLHLVEVRGKLLLLGTTGSAVSVLTEIEAATQSDGFSFDALLEGAEERLTAKGDGAIAAVVHEIDDDLRQAKDAVLETAARMHGWEPGTN
ncbi:MAG: flagellar biosynthetic protein FliO [Chthonomonadales bacterium]